MVEVVRDQQSVPRRTRRRWLRIFLVGLPLWVATVVVIFLTGDPSLIPTRPLRDGMILGAAVGFGFAAFESAGYALIPVPPSRYGTGR